MHIRLLGRWLHALFGWESVEGPTLLDVFAAAMRALHFAFLVVDEGKNLVKEFLAILAEELSGPWEILAW
ncbi:MAG TPA: hypothetical protein VGV15_16315 [Terriglobales bacterium]|nr:hypothetical protein [Terriglobales bacterium]